MRRARMVPTAGGGGGVPFTASAMAGLGGVARRGHGDGRVLMDGRRVVALSGFMVTSTIDVSSKIYAVILP